MFKFLISFCDNAVVEVWLCLGTKTPTCLGLEKDHVLASNTFYG